MIGREHNKTFGSTGCDGNSIRIMNDVYDTHDCNCLHVNNLSTQMIKLSTFNTFLGRPLLYVTPRITFVIIYKSKINQINHVMNYYQEYQPTWMTWQVALLKDAKGPFESWDSRNCCVVDGRPTVEIQSDVDPVAPQPPPTPKVP